MHSVFDVTLLFLRTTRLATFPDYLVIQLKKFTLREDWVPIKLDVAVEMPDVLDLSALKAKGPQPDEEPLPELVGSPPLPVMDEAVLNELADMGKTYDYIKLRPTEIISTPCSRLSTRGLQTSSILHSKFRIRSSYRLDNGTHYRFQFRRPVHPSRH